MFDLMDHLKSKDARRQSLESIQKNHSNFYAGVKAVLQNAQSIQGIIGAVSEHLTFDTRYQTALEIAMGASGQNIIVEDEAAAKRSIDYLKRNRQGRATFLPLTTINHVNLMDNLLKVLPMHRALLVWLPIWLPMRTVYLIFSTPSRGNGNL